MQGGGGRANCSGNWELMYFIFIELGIHDICRDNATMFCAKTKVALPIVLPLYMYVVPSPL